MSWLYLLDDADMNSVSAQTLTVGAHISLTGDEAHHAANVARAKISDEVMVGDGAGTIATCRVTGISAGNVELLVQSLLHRSVQVPRLHVIQALTKGDRAERAIEACTEIGVDEITPYQAVRSVSRWNAEKAAKNQARWQKIVREASKQSIRSSVPVVSPLQTPATLSEILTASSERSVLVLDPLAETALSAVPAAKLRQCLEVVVVSGPEGGFTPEEFELFERSGATRLQLGETVLRASTAPVAALSIINVMLGRW